MIALLLPAQTAWADTIQVTFTGQIYFTFFEAFGALDFHGIRNGDTFSSVLLYDPGQADLDATTGVGAYSNYNYTVTVQTLGGPLAFGGAATHTLNVSNDFNDEFGLADVVDNAYADVGFVFRDYTHTVLSDDSLAGVDWQTLLTQSSQPHYLVRAPNAGVVANGTVRDIFLRDPSNGAVVVVGRINTVDVQTIPSPPTPVPEPNSLFLITSGLFGLMAFRRRA